MHKHRCFAVALRGTTYDFLPVPLALGPIGYHSVRALTPSIGFAMIVERIVRKRFSKSLAVLFTGETNNAGVRDDCLGDITHGDGAAPYLSCV
jgi:hypothetical protein